MRSTLTAEEGALRREMITRKSKRRRQEEAGRMTVTVCGAQVDSLKKTVWFIRPYIQQAYLIHGLCTEFPHPCLRVWCHCDYMISEFRSNGYLSGCSCHLSGDLSHAKPVKRQPELFPQSRDAKVFL